MQEFGQADTAVKAAAGGNPLLAVNGTHARLEGRFQITDSVHVRCEIAGEMEVEGKLVVGETGIVQANVHTVDAVIEGVYEGDMVATGSVEIRASGRVTGNLQTDALVIEAGGFFNGNVKRLAMTEEAAPATTGPSAGRFLAAEPASEPAAEPASKGVLAGSSDESSDAESDESQSGVVDPVLARAGKGTNGASASTQRSKSDRVAAG
jgi:cytoskeletal protein CcmA (bactofilin family)